MNFPILSSVREGCPMSEESSSTPISSPERPKSMPIRLRNTFGMDPAGTSTRGATSTLITGDANVISLASVVDTRISGLSNNIAELQVQLRSIQIQAPANEELSSKVQALTRLAEEAQERSQELTVPVLLPSVEDMQVRLVPSHSLERLEEYRSDESTYYLLFGLFRGAILGILSNWVTDGIFFITCFSAILMGLFAVLTGECGYMIAKIHKRSSPFKIKF
jgi:hypothetical protein